MHIIWASVGNMPPFAAQDSVAAFQSAPPSAVDVVVIKVKPGHPSTVPQPFIVTALLLDVTPVQLAFSPLTV
jgi:hypothetical protein